jgi:hypothetical protein
VRSEERAASVAATQSSTSISPLLAPRLIQPPPEHDLETFYLGYGTQVSQSEISTSDPLITNPRQSANIIPPPTNLRIYPSAPTTSDRPSTTLIPTTLRRDRLSRVRRPHLPPLWRMRAVPAGRARSAVLPAIWEQAAAALPETRARERHRRRACGRRGRRRDPGVGGVWEGGQS